MARDGEAACLEALAAGRDAWPQFWRLFGRLILWELRLLGLTSPAEQEDLYHDLVLKLLNDDCRVLRQYLSTPGQESFAALLRVITRNLGISLLRRAGRNREVELLDVHLPSAGAGPPEWARDPATRHAAQQQLSALLKQAAGAGADSEGYKIMQLRFTQQLSVNSIAAQLGLKPNTVTKRIGYYLERLRGEFGVALRETYDGEA